MPTSEPTIPAKIISNHALTKNIGPADATANRSFMAAIPSIAAPRALALGDVVLHSRWFVSRRCQRENADGLPAAQVETERGIHVGHQCGVGRHTQHPAV